MESVNTHDTLLQTIYQQGHSDELERAILQVIATPGKKGQAYAEMICHLDLASGFFYRDFSNNLRNILCLCIKNWRDAAGDSYAEKPNGKILGLMAARLMHERPDLITSLEIPGVVSEWESVEKPTGLLPVAQNEDLVSSWLRKQRFEKTVKDSHYRITTGGNRLHASAIVERLHKAMELSDLSGMNTAADLVSIDDILKPPTGSTKSTTFYSTGVPVLDKMLGGGYVRGYSYLHVTGSGGGKTVYATHTTVNLAVRQDLKCLWISTEEPENEVYYRLLANFCGVPHEEIRSKLPTGDLVLPPAVKPKFEHAAAKMRENVRVKRWVNEDFNLKADLVSEIREFEAKMGCKPHYILFDWLGASTSELNGANGLRNSLKAKAYHMDQVAKQENLTILFFMQAGEQYKNERFINQAHVDECKTAAVKCPSVIGWSFLPNKGDGTQLASNGVHQDQQFMNVGKSRFGPGGFFQFKREFNIQRFVFPK